MPNGAWVVYILPCEKLEPKSLSHFIHLRSVFSSENCLAFFSAMDASINLPDCVAHYILYSLIWKWFALTYIIRHMYVQTTSPRLSEKLGTEKCPDNQILLYQENLHFHWHPYDSFCIRLYFFSSLLLVCQQHEKRDRSNGRSARPHFPEKVPMKKA